MIIKTTFANLIGPGLKKIYNRSFSPEAYLQLFETDEGYEIIVPVVINKHTKNKYIEILSDLDYILSCVRDNIKSKLELRRKIALKTKKKIKHHYQPRKNAETVIGLLYK